MEYTILKLAKLAGISTRTLRNYDQIGLLMPKKINASGYRIYGEKEVDRLQLIMFYKELELGLKDIKDILDKPGFNETEALIEHKKKLYEKRDQINRLIKNVEKTIAAREGRIIMNDNEKFEGFKQSLIDENEEKYGNEIREKYGKEAVEKSNKKIKNMTKEEYDKINLLAENIKRTLSEAFKTGDPAGELAQKAVQMHKEWLCFYWDKYSKEAHMNVAQIYVDDERFRKYYDNEQPGTAEFLRDAIMVYANK